MCYLRPHELRVLLDRFLDEQQRVYVFIDRADWPHEELNQEVIVEAESRSHNPNLKIFISDLNLGVGSSLPAAVDWISTSEDSFIVLEDDCQLSRTGYKYLEENISRLNQDIVILSATSPWDLEKTNLVSPKLTLSYFPLISGWATNANSWKEMSRYIGRRPPYFKVLIRGIKNPSKILPLHFFLASQIRVHRGQVGAWDSSVALWMLLNEKKSLIPDITMVTNTGRDHVAAHTKPAEGDDSIFRRESFGEPSSVLDLTEESMELTNSEIAKRLYGMKKRQVFSPVKALLETFFN